MTAVQADTHLAIGSEAAADIQLHPAHRFRAVIGRKTGDDSVAARLGTMLITPPTPLSGSMPYNMPVAPEHLNTLYVGGKDAVIWRDAKDAVEGRFSNIALPIGKPRIDSESTMPLVWLMATEASYASTSATVVA